MNRIYNVKLQNIHKTSSEPKHNKIKEVIPDRVKILKYELEVQYYRNKQSEKFYQLLLEDYLEGTHKSLPCGITDITTDKLHAEIKEWSKWKAAVGQVLCYNHKDPKEKMQIYLFGNKVSKSDKEEIFETIKFYNIEPFDIIHDAFTKTAKIYDCKGNMIHEYNPINKNDTQIDSNQSINIVDKV